MSVEERLVEAFLSLHPTHAAQSLEALDTATVIGILNAVGEDTAALTLQHMMPSHAAACLDGVDAARAAAWVERLPLAVAATLLRRIEPTRSTAVLEALPADESTALGVLLHYPAQTVGAVMDPQVQVAPVSATVGAVIRMLHDRPAHVYYYVYVIDASHRLAGVLDLAELLQAEPDVTLASVMRRNVTRLPADMPLSNAVAHPAWIDLDALPVVADDGVFVGMVRHRTVRQLQLADTRDAGADRATDTLVSLGELYWLGLTGLLQGLASTAVKTAAPPDERREPRRTDGH